MSRIHDRYFILALMCLAMLLPGTAAASVRIGIGFGTVIGPHHHHHGWHGGWHRWPYYSHYWYDPWWDPWPVVVAPPVVVRERRVIIEEREPAPVPPQVEKPAPLSEKQQQKRSELLKVLKIGAVDNRVQAVHELEPFARDDKVRTTLEQTLAKDRDPQVRQAVAELFTRLSDKKTLPALKQAYTEDDDRDVRQAAYKAIVMMEGYDGV